MKPKRLFTKAKDYDCAEKPFPSRGFGLFMKIKYAGSAERPFPSRGFWALTQSSSLIHTGLQPGVMTREITETVSTVSRRCTYTGLKPGVNEKEF